MHREGFEPATLAIERRQTEVLDREATGMADIGYMKCKYRLHFQEGSVLLARCWRVCIENSTEDL